MAFTVNWCNWEDIINERFIPLLENRDRYLILYGGRGSSKSNYVAKQLIYRCLTEKYFRCILVRSTYAAIKDSSYQTIKDIIFELGLSSLFEFKLQPLEIHCINGNTFLARGCDDTQKLKSIKDPNCVWYEEDIPTENDFITITTSIRTLKASYLQEIFTINPEVEGNYQDNWFWKRYFKGKDELSFRDVTKLQIDKETSVDLTYTVHHSTYKDNKWIPNEFIGFLIDLKRTNPYYWEVYCNGKWGNRILGGLFYKNFNVARNTFDFEYNPNIPLHISFDFNVNPYMSCSIWHIVGKACYLIDELAMKNPYNTTKGVCNEFKRKYFAHRGGLFVYGDPSGKQQDTRSEKGYNDYKIIQNELDMFKPVLRVATMHPPVAMRGNFINEIFANNYGDISINLYSESVYLKNDLLFGKEASDGTKLKEKVKGEDGTTYEKYHHMSDCFVGSTLITTKEGDIRIDKIQIGDLVLTRNGYKKVVKVWDKGIKPVKTYYIGDKELTCTEDHKLYTYDKGYVNIKALTQWITFCIFDGKKIWKRKLFITTEKHLQDTLIRSEEATEFITQVVEEKKERQLTQGCTNTFGLKLMAKYLKGIVSIIKTKTHLITNWIICNVSNVENTCRYTWKVKTERNCQSKCYRYMPDLKRLCGMALLRGENGILKWLKKLKKKLKSFVVNAEQKQLEKAIKKVDIIIQNTAETGVKKEFQQEHLERKEKVYDIMVEDEHEFFANGILVHNCMDYLFCEAFKSEFMQYQNGEGTAIRRPISQPINTKSKY